MSTPPTAGTATHAHTVAPDGELACHCRRVTYGTVRAATAGGEVHSLADVQAVTTACTRCFGCRFELERMLKDALGDDYRRSTYLARPDDDGSARGPGTARTAALTKRMYMPVLQGFAGSSVRTRVVVFHWAPSNTAPPVDVRADLLTLDGERLGVWNAGVAAGHSAVLEVGELPGAERLTDGVGTLKLVVDADVVGSLRPYFHFVTDTGVTSTHEKSSPARESSTTHRRGYYWTFPVGTGRRADEAYYYYVNATTQTIRDRSLVWRGTEGAELTADVRDRELDQGVMVALHESFPALRETHTAGTVRLAPTAHVAGHIIRYDRGTDRWRVQHL